MKLSICIPTYNRAKLLGETLENIIAQAEKMSGSVEIVVSDNASTDTTAEVVRGYQKRFPNLIYSCADKNYGAERNVLRAVQLAHGEYAWFFGDDDQIAENGLDYLFENYLNHTKSVDMFLMTLFLYDAQLSKLMGTTAADLGVTEDIYTGDTVHFFARYFNELCMTAYIVKREKWLATRPERFVGTGTIMIGGAYDSFDENSHVQLIAKPIVKYRGNNLSWRAEQLDYLLGQIPSGARLVSKRYDSVKDEAIHRFHARFPITIKMLLSLRAEGAYSWKLHQQYISAHWKDRPLKRAQSAFIALCPVKLIYGVRSLYKIMRGHR